MHQTIAYYNPVAHVSETQVALPLERKRHAGIVRYFKLIAFLLAGYAIFGRGFAYLGKSPIFIGEMTLGLGALLFMITRGATNVSSLPQFPFLLLFMAWGACCTVPYIPVWGFDALRDAVMWGYAAFAIVVAALLLVDPTRLPRLFWKYRTFAILFLVAVPILLILKEVLGGGFMPRTPGTNVAFFSPRRGNTMVHMAVICAFIIAGFAHRNTLKVAIFTVPLMMLVATNRAGILTFVVAVGMATVLSRLNKKAVNLWGSMMIVIIIVGVVGVNATMPDGKEVIGLDRLIDKVEGIIGTSGNSRNENSADWRLNWWGDILRDTVVTGRYFWGGLGYGINLATYYGYQVLSDESLRSPHSIHFNILARSGVPGVTLWFLLLASWGVPIFKRYLLCRQLGDARWSGVFLILLTYWSAALVNSSFDVDLEGPMGGIWFWVVYGIGMAALEIHRTRPQVMYQDLDWARHTDVQRETMTRAHWFNQMAARNWQRSMQPVLVDNSNVVRK